MARKSAPSFPPQAIAFLRRLSRNNDREWFRSRKDEYEAVIRGPMVHLVERLAEDLRAFAPELVASPAVSLFRVYRDTRFSHDKSPIKTEIGALFPNRRLGKMHGAGLYFEIAPKHVGIAGGIYAPASKDLLLVRTHVADNLARFRSIVEAPGFRRVTGGLTGEQATRVPRGFSADHPGVDYLRYKQYLVWVELPASSASAPGFYATLLRVFKAAAPLVRFLNEPLVGRPVDPLR